MTTVTGPQIAAQITCGVVEDDQAAPCGFPLGHAGAHANDDDEVIEIDASEQ